MQLSCVFGKPAAAGLCKSELDLNHAERVPSLGANAGFELLNGFKNLSLRWASCFLFPGLMAICQFMLVELLFSIPRYHVSAKTSVSSPCSRCSVWVMS